MLAVSMPFHPATSGLVARAVRSVLNQSHRDLVLVVVNDGGGDDAWKPLRRFRDDRLVRFDLAANEGRYYADAVVLGASEREWWTPHDSDDWSERSRYANLLARTDHSVDVVLGGWVTSHPSGRSSIKMPRLVFDDQRLRYQANHVGLWRTEALRSIGGPHPEWRYAYDTLMVGLATRHLSVVTSDDAGYHHEVRPGSLSSSRETGIGSQARTLAHRKRQRIWLGSRTMDPTRLRGLLAPSPQTVEKLAADIDRLRALL